MFILFQERHMVELPLTVAFGHKNKRQSPEIQRLADVVGIIRTGGQLGVAKSSQS
jgi:hypothetical protein